MGRRSIIGIFDSEEGLISACRAARDAKLPIADAYTPYAVHGLDEAIGIRPTRLGVVCFILGCIGLCVALGFQLWTSAWDWPLNIGGKSYAAIPALIPITFELTILVAAVGTVVAVFARTRLWPGRKATLPASGITDDRFVLVIDSAAGETGAGRDLMRAHGAVEITEREGDG